VDTRLPFAFFSAAAYCSPELTANWTCGPNCDGVSGFEPTATGGDGVDVQFWFVGFHPPLNAIVVAHQGTDPKVILPLVTDVDFFLKPLNSTLFPGLSSDIQVHNGFADEQEKTADEVLAAVKKTMAAHPTNKVVLGSHSLGAAISALDALMLKVQLPKTTTFQVANFGQPRIGNQAFAHYIDSNFAGVFTHTSNQKDPIPTVPGRFLDFVHPSGELHIQDANGTEVACSGQDNTANGCTIASVPTILESDLGNHDGPYYGVEMGDKNCLKPSN